MVKIKIKEYVLIVINCKIQKSEADRGKIQLNVTRFLWEEFKRPMCIVDNQLEIRICIHIHCMFIALWKSCS